MEKNLVSESEKKIKKQFLDNLYYEIGNQKYDFEICSLFKDDAGNTKSKWKWRKYREICFDPNKNKKKFEEINCRSILGNEIVLDLEERENINNILDKLETAGFYYVCYDTGSRGYHIHLFFNEEVTEQEKGRFIFIFGGDIMKKSKRNVIALENHRHWKTGNRKIIFKQTEFSINENRKLRDFIENYIPEEYEEILRDNDLFEKLNLELEKKIEGEAETRKVLLLCCQGRLVENSQLASYNVLVNDDSGTGKDYVTHNTIKLLPDDNFIYKTRISPAAFTYWHNSDSEPDWTWNGKVFYCEDISEDVLNSDVFKVMCSAGSEATIVVKQEAKDIHIDGKPVIITTTANASPNAESTRRFVFLNLDGSEDQTRAIMKRKSQEAISGVKLDYNINLIKAQSFLKRGKVKIHFADKIDMHFPEKNIVMRTNYPRFLDFIKASCMLYQYQREKDNFGFYLATGQDYNIAKECFLKICSNKYMLSLTKHQQNILEYFKINSTEGIPANSLSTKGVITITLKSLIYNLEKLVSYGLLDKSTGTDVYNRDIAMYSLSTTYNSEEALNLPKFEELTKNDGK